MEDRYDWDGLEGCWFDRTKPIRGEMGHCEDRGQLYNEADPHDFIPALQQRIAELEAKLEQATRAGEDWDEYFEAVKEGR